MRRFKNFVTVTTLTALLLSSAGISYADSGDGYWGSRSAFPVDPEYAIGGLAIVAIVAVALQNSGGNSNNNAH